MSQERTGSLTLTFTLPTGEKFAASINIEAVQALELSEILPPGPFSGSFDGMVKLLQVRKYRKDLFTRACRDLGDLLATTMEDKEGWHGVDRQEGIERHRPDFGK